METKVNPLFEIAIRGNKEIANKIHKFLCVRAETTTHKKIFAIDPDITFDREEACYFVKDFTDRIAIGCGFVKYMTSRKIVTLEEAERIMLEWEKSLRQPKQKRHKHKIHKSNCVNQVRFTVTDQLGNIVTVCGKYAYEWTININKDGMVIQTSFENRRKALDELNKLVGKKIK